ncbi:MAG: acetate--CoA ligase [Thermodesulfobacteriota bacterium]
MNEVRKWYDAHLEEYRRVAYVRGMEEYRELYRRSLEDPEGFWGEQAENYLTWFKPWDFVVRSDFSRLEIKWFGGGVLNAAYNCLDRHLPALADKVAYFWEGDEPGQDEAVTFRQLHQRVNKLAALLQSKGVKKGDRVIIYLPMIVELPVSLLACARIGAVHAVVFTGFSAEALAGRILDCEARVVLTADGVPRAGRKIPLKKNVDEALRQCPGVETVVVYDRCGLNPGMTPGRDIWWHEAAADPGLAKSVKPEPMEAEEPLFILYTSGSTGKPKGVVHTHGGYLLYAAMTTRLTFDLKDEEVFWCTADVGWAAGHTYGVYGPLCNGLTSVLFEGVPTYPGPGRCWSIVARYKVAKLYTAPAVIRSLAKEGVEHVEKHDLSSLRLLGSGGEPFDPEAWRWYYHHAGLDRAPIMDTWWQTEAGGHLITPLPGVAPLKPGSCALPFFGVDPVIIDPETGEEAEFPGQEGVLFIRRAWPGLARTFYRNHDRFRETYFSRLPGLYFTGDGAKKDEDGYYWILGRIDDVINVSGHRLGTAEIESALVLHPLVAEAAVVGSPHPLKGQAVYAFVTLNSGAEKSEDLKKELVKLVRSEIGPIATLDAIQWADALPKTRSGKILRRLLQKIAAGLVDRLGDTSTIADPVVIEALIRDRIGVG